MAIMAPPTGMARLCCSTVRKATQVTQSVAQYDHIGSKYDEYARTELCGARLEKEWQMVELGVFLPVISGGWVVSTAAPQYQPSYEMNKAMTLLAEDLGFRFVLSPVKYRGFGGPTEQWDYTLESFEVMAALAEATDRIQLYGSVALPTVHPAITARRAATIDHIS